MHSSPSRGARRRWVYFAIATLIVVLGVAAVWRWSPLHTYAEPKVIAAYFRQFRSSPWAPLALALVYVLASSVLFPNTVLNVATILALGIPYGPVYALSASLVAGLVFYGLGRRYGEARVRAMHIKSVDRMSKMLRNGGVLSMASLRLLPIAPYSVVNVVAGAARVRVFPFAAGTLLGLLPGSLAITAFGHQLRAMLRDPTPMQIAILIALLAVCGAGLWWLKRKALGEDRSEAASSSA